MVISRNGRKLRHGWARDKDEKRWSRSGSWEEGTRDERDSEWDTAGSAWELSVKKGNGWIVGISVLPWRMQGIGVYPGCIWTWRSHGIRLWDID